MVFRLVILGQLLLSLTGVVLAQSGCDLFVAGRLLDEHDREELAFATVYSLTEARGTQADAMGNFRLEGLCAGAQRIRFSHIGCDPKIVDFVLSGDTTVSVSLHHHDNYTETVTVSSARGNIAYSERIGGQSEKQLSEVLEELNGVSSLRTGTAAAKPVVDGLYGNRLSIQNNGIAQSGQQWGNDHAPEIDPWVAAYVRVVEGVDALRYGGSTLGPTVLIEPAPLNGSLQSGGRAGYGFQSNGRGHVLNGRVQDSTFLLYRLSGTLKVRGDRSAPDYYLNNTGNREANVALQVAKSLRPNLTARGYYSLFNAEIGVLRGSHIGNLTDLRTAIGRSEPFFTEDDFSYEIGSPRQRVSHHLLKGEVEYAPNDRYRIGLRYGGQLDLRREFDVRRGDDDRPALELEQFSHLLETWFRRDGVGQGHLEGGIQTTLVSNDNVPGTGILPLIPDYNGQLYSGYLTYHREGSGPHLHFGTRYDVQSYEAITISRDLPRRVERFDHRFGALSGSAEINFRPERALRYQLSLNYRERAPQINELYSQGLHQGVSGIEEGDPELDKERSLKLTAGFHYATADGRLTLTGRAFAQRVGGFIQLEPQDSFRLTIRGAFPVFRYRGLDARLYGANLSVLAELTDRLRADARLAIIRGREVASGRSLVFLPTDNLRTTLTYEFNDRLDVRVGALLVGKSGQLGEDQDFLAAPEGYVLLETGAGYRFSDRWKLNLAVENLLNTRYRDYLDRQRYYADATGRSVNLRVTFDW